MNRWPSRAGRKAPINRTHSKRFAIAVESADHAVAFGVRASSAPLSQGRLQFDGRAGSWKASFRVGPCIGTMNPPLIPPRRGTDRTRTNACSPPGRVGGGSVHGERIPRALGRHLFGVPPSGGPDRLKPGLQTVGSWRALIRLCARIATMNQGGEIVARASRPRCRAHGRDARATTRRFTESRLSGFRT